MRGIIFFFFSSRRRHTRYWRDWSSDVCSSDLYALLHASLDASGSDFAGGVVRRFGAGGTWTARIQGNAYAATDRGTHVVRRPELLLDRIVTNKLWRRSFWDQAELRFPEGVLYEDIQVALGAHVVAEQVDVIARPV